MMRRTACILVAAMAGIFMLGGCTFDAGIVSGSSDEAGAVWIEPATDGGFTVASLPTARGADVFVTTLAAAPDGYTGPGVYVATADGYALEIDGAGLTLDDVLMTWDPAPAASN